eukprot:4855951-Pleurochrysis_carterae.AAC.1
MLTRFATAVPCVTTSAEETLSILMNHVIAKCSFPTVIKSENGSAFRNELTRAFAKYAGLRRAFVLLYNAPVNAWHGGASGGAYRLFTGSPHPAVPELA